MKSLSLIAALVSTTAAIGCSSTTVSVAEQPIIQEVSSEQKSTTIKLPAIEPDNIYLTRTLNNATFSAGFFIDSNGINSPVISTILPDGARRNYAVEEIVTDIFSYQSIIIAALLSGKTLALDSGEWVANELQLPYNATVIHTNKANLIACAPFSPIKSSNMRGGCTSINPDWHISIPWRSIPPKVCNGHIYAMISLPNKNEYWKISTVNGEILNRDAYQGVSECLNRSPSL